MFERNKKFQKGEPISVISLNYFNDSGKNDFKNAENKQKSKRANIEEALEATQFGKFNYFIILISGILLTTVLIELLSISFILPLTDCDLKLKTEEKSIICASAFVGIISSSYLWGLLADTIGRRKVLRFAILAAFSTTVISSFLNNFWSLLVFRFLNGFFASAACSIPLAYLGEFHTNKIRSKVIMGASIMYGLLALVVPIVAWLMINQSWRFYIPFIDITYKPWRLFMIVCGLPELLSSLCLYVIPETPKFTLLQKDHNTTMKTLRKMYRINTGKPTDDYPYTEVFQEENSECKLTGKMHGISDIFQSMRRQTAPLFRANFLRQTILICLIRFLIFILTNGMNVWFPKVLDQIGEYQNKYPNNRTTICGIFHRKHIAVSDIETVVQCKETLDISTYYNTILLEVGYLLGSILLTSIVNHVGKNKLLFAILFVTGACGVAAVIVDIPLLATYLYLVSMLGGLSSIVLNIIIIDIYPTSLRAMAVSLTFLAGYIGGVFGSNIIGTLLDNSCNWAFLLAACSLIIGSFLGLLIPQPRTDSSTITIINNT